jgi:hypothetical protein
VSEGSAGLGGVDILICLMVHATLRSLFQTNDHNSANFTPREAISDLTALENLATVY